MLLDTGIRVSDLCELRVGDIDRMLGTLRIRGNQTSKRCLPLSSQGWHQMLSYLDEHRCKSTAVSGRDLGEEYLFLTEMYQPLTKNALTLLFARLKKRAGFTDTPVSPSLLHDMFAVRYLQVGGTIEGLGVQLGVRDLEGLKRYEHAARSLSDPTAGEKPVEVHES